MINQKPFLVFKDTELFHAVSLSFKDQNVSTFLISVLSSAGIVIFLTLLLFLILPNFRSSKIEIKHNTPFKFARHVSDTQYPSSVKGCL